MHSKLLVRSSGRLCARAENCIWRLGRAFHARADHAITVRESDISDHFFIDTNVKGVANMLRHLVLLMIESKQGIIVNMSYGLAAKELYSGMAIVARNPAPRIARFLSSNSTYIYLSVSFIQMLKALMLVAVYSIGIIFRKDSFNSNTMANMLSISFGVAIATYGEAKFDSWGEMIFRDISFKYGEDMPLVLNGLDLHLKAGETVAFVGPSGGGNTTLMKLLLRLYDPLCVFEKVDTVLMAKQTFSYIDRAYEESMEDDYRPQKNLNAFIDYTYPPQFMQVMEAFATYQPLDPKFANYEPLDLAFAKINLGNFSSASPSSTWDVTAFSFAPPPSAWDIATHFSSRSIGWGSWPKLDESKLRERIHHRFVEFAIPLSIPFSARSLVVYPYVPIDHQRSLEDNLLVA
ncbi:hypothetical protein CsSME_00010348 [Camellia sinensis var. sinensis]